MMLHHVLELQAAAARARGPWDHLPLPASWRRVAPERAVWLSSLSDELARCLETLGPELCELHRRGTLQAAGMRLARLDLSPAVELEAMGASEVRTGQATYHVLMVRR